MIASGIRFLLQNLPAVLFVFALVLAAATRRDGPTAERFLSWILLLPIGVTGLWAGAFHVFLPETIGHMREMVMAGNFAPGNAGVPFYMDIIAPLSAIALLFVSSRRKDGRSL